MNVLLRDERSETVIIQISWSHFARTGQSEKLSSSEYEQSLSVGTIIDYNLL